MIPVNTPSLDGNERQYVNECLDSGWISSEGPFVARFERAMATYVGRKHGVALCNGSVALDLAMVVLGIKSGDEVILPSFTIISCASAITRVGARPVPIDCDPQTWNIDVDHVRAAITPRTRAILLVHIYGLPIDVIPILALAREHGLLVIEDAAEAHGVKCRGRQCGSFGDISAFSFYPNKHVTTGEGGMLLTDDDELAEKCRYYRNLCFRAEARFVHTELGWNYRMSNLQAAIGLAQVERLPLTVQRKREVGLRYRELVSDIDGLELQTDITSYASNVYWVFGIVLSERIKSDAKTLASNLLSCGVGSRPFFWPIHEQPVLRRERLIPETVLPVSERLARRGLYLPSSVGLRMEEQEFVVNALRRSLNAAIK